MRFKHCLFLLQTGDNQINYCLKFHEWIDRCPRRCGFHILGEPAKMDDIKEKKFNFECLYFTCTENGQYMCRLLQVEEPFCDQCLHATYDRTLQEE